MKRIIKKNQLMISALAIMIAIAGYLQFAGKSTQEELLAANEVGSGQVITEHFEEEYTNEVTNEIFDLSDADLYADPAMEIVSLDTDDQTPVENYLDVSMEDAVAQVTPDAGEIPGDAVAQVTPDAGEIPGDAVYTSGLGVEILADAKIMKEQTRAKNKETLLEIINSAGIGDEQKQEAVNNMVSMTTIAEKETAAEILLEAKGFQDVVVSLHSDSVDVVVNALELSDVQRAQIEDIVSRKTDVPVENIIISTVAR